MDEIESPKEIWKAVVPKLQQDVQGEYPKISVIIPTFQAGYSIKRTLDSIASQEYPNVEIIIIDGGSTDKTLKVVKEYKRLPVELYFVTDYNLVLMCDKGVSLATGEYVNFLWPGRTYLSHYGLTHIGQSILNNDKPDLVYCGCYITYTYSCNPFVYSYPISLKELKKGNLPIIFSCWFKRENLIKMDVLNRSYSFRKAWFDLLCRFTKNPQLNSFASNWVLFNFNYRDISTRFVLKDYWDRGVIIFKHFGPLSVGLWLLRKKDFPFFPWLYRKLRRHFVGK